MKENEVLPEVLMQSILAKLYDTIMNGDGDVVPRSEDNFFNWAPVGIPMREEDLRFLSLGLTGVISQENLPKDEEGNPIPLSELPSELYEQFIATDTNQLYVQAETLARLVDFVPSIDVDNKGGLAKLNIQENEGTLSDVYEYALRFSQVANSELTEKEKEDLKRYRGLLETKSIKEDLITGEEKEVVEPSPLVKVYHEKMQAYVDAALNYNARRVAALTGKNAEAVHYWALNASLLRQKVKAAMGDWISNGYKNEFEGINARIDQILSKDLSLMKAEYKDTLERAKLTGVASGSDFYYTTLVPGNFTKGGWTEFSFKSSDFNSEFKSEKTSWGGSTGVSFWGIKLGGGTKHEKATTDFHVDSSKFSLRFEICEVPIVRPWFKTSFLTSRAWKLDPSTSPEIESRGELLSDGGMPPKGLMPGYPTSVVFVRNLKLDFGKRSSDYTSLVESNKSGGAISWGPFSIGGSYKSNTSERNINTESSSQGIEVEGMQIIGFKCHVLPKSPDPLPSIENWI